MLLFFILSHLCQCFSSALNAAQSNKRDNSSIQIWTQSLRYKSPTVLVWRSYPILKFAQDFRSKCVCNVCLLIWLWPGKDQDNSNTIDAFLKRVGLEAITTGGNMDAMDQTNCKAKYIMQTNESIKVKVSKRPIWSAEIIWVIISDTKDYESNLKLQLIFLITVAQSFNAVMCEISEEL